MRAEGGLPFFVYGTLRPGEQNHDLCLRGRVAEEEPARLAGALLYDGPGYPYAVEAPDITAFGTTAPGAVVSGTVVGELVTAKPGKYHELLTELDELEGYEAPGDPRNLYVRVVRDVLRSDGTPVRAWVYFAAPRVAHGLRAHGRLIAGGDWLAHLRGR
ncbi:gamma-glutamylcyclotransferase family protein [Streptomyces sp. 35G-GA-8]|uniref:gamma-glutamylcyclotransferase family protein n=1 Tax=Streptomyces sp. 35G-GA-8 TaxID=2939434 RepID=UPI00201EA8D8|nr:gamma-glutamylcyclotransferase family protein [Streptomyces sp. 35G-GA-8]MCL7377247.1 gamma-glutamylcyclotransferase [Streptomyces sp. 35G-GA-8]